MHQIYKIFIRNKPLIIASEKEVDNYKQFKQLQSLSAKEIKSICNNINDSSDAEGLIYVHKNPDEVIEELKKDLKLIQAAGGLVWNDMEELLMIFRRGKWDLPKGKIEE